MVTWLNIGFSRTPWRYLTFLTTEMFHDKQIKNLCYLFVQWTLKHPETETLKTVLSYRRCIFKNKYPEIFLAFFFRLLDLRIIVQYLAVLLPDKQNVPAIKSYFFFSCYEMLIFSNYAINFPMYSPYCVYAED